MRRETVDTKNEAYVHKRASHSPHNRHKLNWIHKYCGMIELSVQQNDKFKSLLEYYLVEHKCCKEERKKSFMTYMKTSHLLPMIRSRSSFLSSHYSWKSYSVWLTNQLSHHHSIFNTNERLSQVFTATRIK